MEQQIEYSATELRKLLQHLFPQRRLVLSQFTFFNNSGIAKPSGETFRRGRRCYRLVDVLPIACILALKEEGIPFKNIEPLPSLLRDCAQKIFRVGPGVRITGFGERIFLDIPETAEEENVALEAHLENSADSLLCIDKRRKLRSVPSDKTDD